VYIKSACEPFDAEMKMDWKRVRNWLNHFGVKIDRTHVSGHASGLQLKEFVQEVNAKNLIPIHTENAKGFEGWSENTTLLGKVGESYTL
jgi:ribonuclease J